MKGFYVNGIIILYRLIKRNFNIKMILLYLKDFIHGKLWNRFVKFS